MAGKFQYKELCRIRMREGKCVTCGRKKEPGRFANWRCEACKTKYAPGVRERAKQYRTAEYDPGHARTLPCLRCGEPLKSPDARFVRFHDSCRYATNQTLDTLGMAEAIFDC